MAVLTSVAPGAVRGRGDRTMLLLLPAIAVLLVMFVVPVGIVVWRSVSDPELGFGNYAWIFTSPTATASLVRTFVIAALVTIITLILAYPYAYLMLVSGPRARAALTLIALLPFWTSLMVRTFAWMILLQDNGVVSAITGQTLLGTTTGVLIGMARAAALHGAAALRDDDGGGHPARAGCPDTRSTAAEGLRHGLRATDAARGGGRLPNGFHHRAGLLRHPGAARLAPSTR